MATIKLVAPKGAQKVAYKAIEFGVEPDGTLTVPVFAAAEMGSIDRVDVRAELAGASATELGIFLMSRGQPFDPLQPTDVLRKKAFKLYESEQ